MSVAVGCSVVVCLDAAAAGPAQEALKGLMPAGITAPFPTVPSAAFVPETGEKYMKAPDILTASDYAGIGQAPSESYFGGEDKADFTPAVKAQVTDILSKNAAGGKDKEIYAKMYRRWTRGVRVLIAPSGSRDFDTCIKAGALAFARAVGQDPIYLCRPLIINDGYSETYVAQTIIHEMAHVIGYKNECTVTRLEQNALKNAGLKPGFNGYVVKCGLI